jgi:hypothetical protein
MRSFTRRYRELWLQIILVDRDCSRRAAAMFQLPFEKPMRGHKQAVNFLQYTENTFY